MMRLLSSLLLPFSTKKFLKPPRTQKKSCIKNYGFATSIHLFSGKWSLLYCLKIGDKCYSNAWDYDGKRNASCQPELNAIVQLLPFIKSMQQYKDITIYYRHGKIKQFLNKSLTPRNKQIKRLLGIIYQWAKLSNGKLVHDPQRIKKDKKYRKALEETKKTKQERKRKKRMEDVN